MNIREIHENKKQFLRVSLDLGDPPAGFCDKGRLCMGCGNGRKEEKAGLLVGGVPDHRGGTLRADDAPGPL